MVADDYGPPLPPDTPKLKRYLAAILRYKWMVLALVVAGTALGVFGSRFLGLTYTAEATLWVEVRDPNSNRQAQGPITSPELLQDIAWTELIRSNAILDKVVMDHRLYLHYDWNDGDLFRDFQLDTTSMIRPGTYKVTHASNSSKVEVYTTEGMLVDTATAGGPIGKPMGFIWQPDSAQLLARPEFTFTVLAPRDAAKGLDSGLGTSMRPLRASFIGLTYSAGNPGRAATVLNAVIDRTVTVATDLKAAKLRELRDILARQMATAEENLRRAELDLESFKVQTVTLPSDPASATPVTPGLASTQQSVLTNYFEMKISRDALLRDRDAIARALSPVGEQLSIDALAVVPAVRASTELLATLEQLAQKRAGLRALRNEQQLTDEHRQVIRLKDEIAEIEERVIPQQARAVVSDLERRADMTDQLIDAASEELKQIPPRAIEEARYERAVATAENIYIDLRQRYENARLAAETTLPDIRVHDRAEPPHMPNSDKRMLVILFMFAASLGGALLLAIVLDLLDPKLRYAEQVTHGLQLPILGAVPYVPVGKQADQVHALEALRALRLSLTTAYGTAGPMVLTISSPGAADGKTFLTANLGMSYADLGLRVLLIDADTRRGNLHRVMERTRKPGLTDLLSGTATIEEAIQTTPFNNVHMIACGTHRSSAPELLSSSRMGNLLAAVRGAYDVVLFDSPPLGAGVDPLVLATLSSNLLLIMRTGKTHRALAEAKLQMLDRLPVRMLGVVLNGVPSGEEYRYYSYLPGYEAVDEQLSALQPAGAED